MRLQCWAACLSARSLNVILRRAQSAQLTSEVAFSGSKKGEAAAVYANKGLGRQLLNVQQLYSKVSAHRLKLKYASEF